MSAPILITVPKYVAISPSPLPRVFENSLDSISSSASEDSGRAKKRRLDHLTWEEKIQRKKLKNRVAAQTSRDRKKAKMDDMAQTIHALTQQTEILKNKCDSLQSINESLMQKNAKLDREVAELQRRLGEIQDERKPDIVLAKSGCVGYNSNDLLRSAASNPRQQGMELKSTQRDLNNTKTTTLWKIVALCLLYKTCSKISTPPNSKISPKAYSRISPQTWRTAIQRAALMLPKAKAPQSDCLDQWWGPQQKCWNPAKISLTA